MLRANEAAVFQKANAAFVGLRYLEVHYFNQFFSNFATQSTIMIGFVFGGIYQSTKPGEVYGILPTTICWILGALGIVSGLLVLISCMFLTVFGQSYALRGPVGSMVKAVNGMEEYQLQVLVAFCVTCVCMNGNLIGVYFLNMKFQFAVLCTVINLLGVYSWYYSCLRIYNRFKYEHINTLEVHQNRESVDEETDIKRTLLMETSHFNELESVVRNKPDNLTKKLLSNDHYRQHQHQHQSSTSTWSPFHVQRATKRDEQNNQQQKLDMVAKLILKGYLTLKDGGGRFNHSLKRVYAVLHGPFLNFYVDEQAFLLHPHNPKNKRPIVFLDYVVEDEVSDEYFGLVVVPADPDDHRKVWEFHFDTMVELNEWRSALLMSINIVSQHHESESMSLSANSTTYLSRAS